MLIVSPEPWGAHHVSKHQYAIVLAERGAQVFFLNPPQYSLDDIQIRSVSTVPGLHVVHAPRLVAGLRFYPTLLRRWLEARWLERLEQTAGCRFDAIWLFENSRFYDMRFAGDRLKIYHQVDLNQNFHPATAAATADICYCTSDIIRERLLPYNPRVFKIHHGTPMPHALAGMDEEQLARFQHTGAQAAYIGNLDMAYLDTELLAQAAERFPQVRFHFVGGYSQAGALWQRAGSLPNVVWWGKLQSSQIPAVLAKVDVLLVTYQAERWRDQLSSPHKFMEYMASGKVTVATYTDEYKDKRHLLQMVDNSADYLNAFAGVIERLNEYNSTTLQAERIAFAQAHTYEHQLNRIFDLMAAQVSTQKVEPLFPDPDKHAKK